MSRLQRKLVETKWYEIFAVVFEMFLKNVKMKCNVNIIIFVFVLHLYLNEKESFI